MGSSVSLDEPPMSVNQCSGDINEPAMSVIPSPSTSDITTQTSNPEDDIITQTSNPEKGITTQGITTQTSNPEEGIITKGITTQTANPEKGITTQTSKEGSPSVPEGVPVVTAARVEEGTRRVSTGTMSLASLKQMDQNRLNEECQKDEAYADAKDVMISYSHADTEMMKRIRATLESHGLTVWVDIAGLTAGVDFLAKIGQAIIDCQVFISLLSEKTISSRCCVDELALAYVSNKPIYPIGLQTPQELLPLMDTGMRLQLARYDWFLVTNPATFDAQMEDFSTKLAFIVRKEAEARRQQEYPPKTEQPEVKRCHTFRRAKSVMEKSQTMDESMLSTFWERHFDASTHTPWEAFKKAFNEEYSKSLQQVFQIKNTDWLLRLLYRELEVKYNDGNVLLEAYTNFCTVDGELSTLWARVQDQAIESYSMREVFNMNSTVRVEAIENLGRLRSKAVVEALMDLLEDQDNNVVTVAALSLAKTGDNSQRVVKKLLECLESDDRLVRESGCLALGHLRAKQAVSKLIHLWRNDFISSVREASNVALEQIGGEEASKAIHITNLLAKEIRSLTQSQ